MKRFLSYLILLGAALCSSLRAQEIIPMSVKELAPDFNIRPQFLDDTIYIVRYLDSLNGTNASLTDTCVTLNAKLMAMENVLKYDYRHDHDTVWINATHYLEDYKVYVRRIHRISQFVLDRAHYYIEREHIRQDNLQQSALNLRKDSIDRQHRTIVNACEGIGINDKDRKKELKDIFYAYLSVYNRYDFSMKRSDSLYLLSLDQFSKFQQDLIEDLLSSNNYTAKIYNFANTLKVRCGHTHTEVLRSYQRAFRQPTPDISFSSINEYYSYVAALKNIIQIQNSYLTVVDLREQITSTSKRIINLYYARSREVANTYEQVTSTINMVPAFNNLYDAYEFVSYLKEFIQVQECYIQDFNRLNRIQIQGDSLVDRCSFKYVDVAKAYKHAREVNPMTPRYQSLDDAVRFSREMDRFETMQLQFDSVLQLRQELNDLKDSINKGWMQHLTLYNGFNSIRKQFALTPTFIDVDGGTEFIGQLIAYRAMENRCLEAIEMHEQYKLLDNQLVPKLSPYRNIRKAYSLLNETYLTIKFINHFTELNIYMRQLDAFITVQETIMDITSGNDAPIIESRLEGVKEIDKIEKILGL